MLKSFRKTLLCITLLCNTLLAYETIGSAFTASITGTTKVLDRYTGTFYVATDGTSGGDGANSLAYAGKSDTSFTSLAGTGTFNTTGGVRTIALLRNDGGAATHIVGVVSDSSNSQSIKQLALHNLSSGAESIITEADLGLSDDGGDPTNQITLIATSSAHIFARVVDILGTELTAQHNGIAFIRNDSTPTIVQGTNGTPALPLSLVAATLRDGGATNYAKFAVSDMIWDNDLETLFITGTGSLAAADAANGHYSLVKAKITAGALGLEIITPAANTVLSTDATVPFAILDIPNGFTAPFILGFHKIRIMTTSTGMKYLIGNGGLHSGANIKGNEFHAMRLAQTAAAGILTGDIIKGNVSAETALGADFTNADHQISTTVGAGIAPWDNTVSCSDMVVVGDAVYVSGIASGLARSATVDPGIWKSQARFDHQGLIIGWTPWERVFPTIDGTTAELVPFFDVDARTGKIWRGCGGNDAAAGRGKTITRTKWALANATANTLQNKLASDLANGSYCVLDLPVNLPGLAAAAANANNSFTLFGGLEKVAFVRTKSGAVNANTGISAYNAAADYLLTSNGLAGTGAVRSLAYIADGSANTTGYFLAGTDLGLFAYAAAAGTGFATGLTTLDAAPFDDGTWQRAASHAITSTIAISQIVTCTGNRAYAIGLDTQTINGIVDRLYEINPGANVSSFGVRIVAESGKGGLPDNAVFSGCAVITTTSALRKASDLYKGTFGVIATNDGIYTSTCDLKFVAPAGTPISGEWIQITSTNDIAFYGVKQPKDIRGIADFAYYPFQTTHFNALPIIDDSVANLGIYEKSSFLQAGLSGNARQNNAAFAVTTQSIVPSSDTSGDAKNRRFALNSSTNIKNVELTTNFYSDGARRFFTKFNPSQPAYFNALRTLPYNATEWNMTVPDADGDLGTVTRINWIENISGTGQLMAGTDTGVIVLG